MVEKNDESDGVPLFVRNQPSFNTIDQIMRSILLCTVSSIVVFGSIWNITGHKYSKAREYPGCSHTIVNLYVPQSITCCDNESSWICAASFDSINSIMSSYWSLIIPLLPCFSTFIFDIQSNNYLRHFKRISIYIIILIVRMV